MPPMPQPFPQPPLTHTAEGHPRRIGIELEMSGLSLDAASDCVAAIFGLEVNVVSRYERSLSGDVAGPWIVELDSSVVKRLGRAPRDPATLRGEIVNTAEAALARMAGALLPIEVVSPPLPLARLAEIERLIDRLRAAGARGTSDRLLNAFGMQLNPEAPATDAPTITAYLKAFLCLYDWLFARADIDRTRRITTFVDPFPRAYAQRVVDPAYAPDLATLVADYLRWNPTRNRALDLLPLLAHVAPGPVRAAVADPRVKARPAFHYRLPDCEIHRPDWRLAPIWADWLEVERLASDPDRLAGCAAAYHAFLARPLERWLGDWASEVERAWLGR